MTIEQIKQELNRAFGKYEFVEDGHYYLCNGKRVGISTTGLIHQYSQEFDSETIAQRVATKRNVSVDEILEEWRIENLHSTIKGNMIHQYAQSLWEQKEYIFDYSQVPQEIDLERLKSDIAKLIPQADNFYNDYKDMYTLIGCEMYLGDEEFDECGATDQLMLNNYTQEIAVWDYKSNKEIVYKTKYNQKMKVPLQKFDDVNHIHYSLQLCDYAYKIEKNTNLKIGEKMLIHFDTTKENYTIIEPLDMMEEAKKILEMRDKKKMKTVIIMGGSGTGKSFSFKNLPANETAILSVAKTELPFRNKNGIKFVQCEDYEVIKKSIMATKKRIIIVDDASFLTQFETLKKASQGSDFGKKENGIAKNFYEFLQISRQFGANDEKILYITMHERKNDSGVIAPKTCGNSVDDRINVEGQVNILFRSLNKDGEYVFQTKNNGDSVCKTPYEMFSEEFIPNDLLEIDKTIREYYGYKPIDEKLEIKEDKKEEEK